MKLAASKTLPVPNFAQISRVGFHHEDHRLEASNDIRDHPAMFLRTPASRATNESPRPHPLAVVIGRAGRRVLRQQTWSHVSAYSRYNDGGSRRGAGARKAPQVVSRPGCIVEVEIDQAGSPRNTIADD